MAMNRLTGLDAIFLAAETAECPLHVMAIVLLDPSTVPGGYRFEKLREFVLGRLEILRPLRRRIVEVPFGLDQPGWVEEPNIDIDDHLRRAALPSPAGREELTRLASEIMERPLDRSKPLWEMVVVEDLADGNIGLIAKVHHAMMDGFAGVKLMSSLFAETPEYEELHYVPPARAESPPGGLELLARALPAMATRTATAARAVAHTARAQLESLLEGGSEEEEESAADGQQVPLTLFNAKISSRRCAAYESLPLADLKAVKRHFGVTLNDVLLASVASATRAHLLAHDALPDAPLFAGCPVSTHAKDDEAANSYSNMFVSLATHIADPVERLLAIHEGTRRTKRARTSSGGAPFGELMQIPAPFVFSLIAEAYTRFSLWESVDPMCNFVVSNVPGPREALYVGGARLVALYPLGPIFEGMALNITAISCGDSLGVGLVGCRDWVPDLWALSDRIGAGLEELVERLPGEQARPAGDASVAAHVDAEPDAMRAEEPAVEDALPGGAAPDEASLGELEEEEAARPESEGETYDESERAVAR